MKSIKTIGLTLFLFIGFIMPSCKKEKTNGFGCNCSNVQYFNIKGLDDFRYTTSGSSPTVIMPFDTISFAEFEGQFIIPYQATFHAFAEPKTDFSFSLIKTANACHCVSGYSGSKTEKIKNFSITTINDFDSQHPAGSDISDLFNTIDSEGKLISFDEFIQNQTGLIKRHWYSLKLKKAPVLNTEFNFKIEIELSTGEMYEKTGVPIFIEP